MKCWDWKSKDKAWQEISLPESKYNVYLVGHLEAMVRESAYNLCILENGGDTAVLNKAHGESYSRAVNLFQIACRTLRSFSPTAEEYIKATYVPKASNHYCANEGERQ